jgi:hypothetical protein
MPDISKCRLIRLTQFPPGGFPFSETVKGQTYDYPDIGLDVGQQSIAILKVRKANGLPRASIDEVQDDLISFTCMRLGCDPTYCYDGFPKGGNPVPFTQSSGSCGTCGAKV